MGGLHRFNPAYDVISSNADSILVNVPMVGQKVQIPIEQLGFDKIFAASCPLPLKRGHIHFVVDKLDLSMRSTSNIAALLCVVNSSRILIHEGFKTSTPHNGKLHIITELCIFASADKHMCCFRELLLSIKLFLPLVFYEMIASASLDQNQ
jgi:hypothetical protein